MPILDKDMRLCISLAGRPSNIGTRFHNFLYDELGLPYVYKAFTTTDIEGAIRGVRALGIRGCSVSMPFKEAVIPLVDDVEPSASAIDAVNTIVNDDGLLTASNTDYEAVAGLLVERDVAPSSSVLVRGSGGMAKAVVAALRDHGIGRLTLLARNPESGPALADRYDAVWVGRESDAPDADLLVNATPLGMDGPDADRLAFDATRVESAAAVLDVVAFPSDTPLIRTASAAGVEVITGDDVIARQAARQFERYTGVTPTADQRRRAAAFSRS